MYTCYSFNLLLIAVSCCWLAHTNCLFDFCVLSIFHVLLWKWFALYSVCCWCHDYKIITKYRWLQCNPFYFLTHSFNKFDTTTAPLRLHCLQWFYRLKCVCMLSLYWFKIWNRDDIPLTSVWANRRFWKFFNRIKQNKTIHLFKLHFLYKITVTV